MLKLQKQKKKLQLQIIAYFTDEEEVDERELKSNEPMLRKEKGDNKNYTITSGQKKKNKKGRRDKPFIIKCDKCN